MELELQVKSVYGVDRIYPVNDKAKKIVELVGRKTLTSADVKLLKDVGFTIKWTPISI